MPSAATLKLFRTRKVAATPQIGSFEVIQDKAFVGYKTKLKWKYDDPNIVGFRIWRAISTKVVLRREYLIPQIALEKITGLRTFHSRNTALYSKQFFSENSKVKFFQSKSTRYKKPDETEEIESYRFQEIAFVRKNRQVYGGPLSSNYEFIDKRIKFGESYVYVISALTTGMFDSKKSRPVTVRVEDLAHPDPPKNIKLSVGSSSIIVNIDTDTTAKDVAGFVIFRKEDAEENFSRVADINADELEIVNWLDFQVIPGRAYTYKVYSKDYYGNLSFAATAHRIRYDIGFPQKADVPPPEFDLRVDTGKVILTGRKNSEDIIGYRFERKDVWRFEEKFEIKDYTGIPWPNVNLFDESGSAELIDRTVAPGNVYQYRVSAIKKNGIPATYALTPQVRIDEDLVYPEPQDKEDKEDKANLIFFNVCLEDTKQKPIFTKFSWNIEGDWSYMLVNMIRGAVFDGKTAANPARAVLKIDNVHESNEIYFTQLELSNSYEMRVEVYDGNGNLLDKGDENQTTRVTI